MSALAFNLAFAFYAVGLFHNMAAFALKRDFLFRVAFAAQTIGFGIHSLFLVLSGLEEGHFPLTNMREALLFFAWTVTLCFLVSHWRYRIRAVGLVALPLVTFLMVGTAFLKSYPPPEILRSSWVYWHTTCLLVAYGMFFVTSIASLLYLVQQRQIKSRKPSLLQERFPALLTMDDLFQKFLIGGFCFMTVGLLTGMVWAEEQWTEGWYRDPKVISSVITWLIYLILIFFRLSAGWRGKRAAILSLVGFLSVLFTFFGSRALFEGLHSF